MYVARKVERDVAAKVRKLGIDGVSFVSEPKRYYPAGALAAPLLGFVGIDNDGLGGIENGFENTLAGKPGEMKVERDPQGRELPEGVQQGRSPSAARTSCSPSTSRCSTRWSASSPKR